MTTNQQKKSNYISMIGQLILIVSFVLGLIYFPVNIKFAEVQKRIDGLEKEHEEHCLNAKEEFAKTPNAKLVELQFAHIAKSLDDIHAELSRSRSTDEKFQKTLQEILVKLK